MTWTEFYSLIKNDLHNHGGNTFIRKIKNFLFNPSFRLLLNYRIGRYLVLKNNSICKILVAYLMYRQTTKHNCQISYKADIGEGIYFPHPIGIVIGEGVIIRNNVKIWQHVTLGSHGDKEQNMAYPVIEDGVRIFTNAVIFGDIRIGENATIGASALVFINVPPNKVAIGNPAILK